ncbi:putative nucleosome remodeling complex ATPase subunit (Snf2h), partial [Aspergillus homomorphus CBS 101889]
SDSTPEDVIKDIKRRRDSFLRAKRDLILPLLDDTPAVLSDSEDYVQQSIEPPQQLTNQPRGLRATLKPYQLDGLSFLTYLRRNGVGGILADEMGLGKTLQTLTLFEHVKEVEGASCSNPAPFLVVCPLSVLEIWISEISKWTPGLAAVKFHGTREQRADVKKLFVKKQGKEGCFKEDVRNTVVITCYETFMSEVLWFRKVAIWKYVVLDEGHRIKDSTSKRAQAIGKIRAEYKLILTGTPIQNNLGEVWSLLHWLFPEVFTPSSAKLFKDAFSLNEGRFDAAFSGHIKRFLNLIMLRRLKDSPQVGINLPPKQVVTLAVPLSKLQHSLYMKVLTGLDESLGEASKLTFSPDEQGWPVEEPIFDPNKPATKRKWKISDNILMELRKCSIHPWLLNDSREDSDDSGGSLLSCSGKLLALSKLIKHFVFTEKKKVVIFSCFVMALNLCEELLGSLQNGDPFEYVRLDGNTSRAWRRLSVHLFNTLPQFMVFLVSIRAGGEGLNLIGSSVVIFLDEDWNPQVMRQAESRVHRIGQTQPVQIFRLISKGTLEEQMSRRLLKKAYLSSKIIEEERIFEAGTGQDDEDGLPEIHATPPMRLIASEGLPENNLAAMDSWSFRSLLSRCAISSTTGQDLSNSSSWWKVSERMRTNIFNGKKVEKVSRFQAFPEDPPCFARAERRIGKGRLITIEGYDVTKENLRMHVPREASSPKKTKSRESGTVKSMSNETTCGVCKKFEPLACQTCPRAYHWECLQDSTKSHTSIHRFSCPHHVCFECQKRTADAGGLLFCCMRCPLAFCEDCLDWGKTEFIGRNHSFEVFGYHPHSYFYIHCPGCIGGRKRRGDEANVLTSKRYRLRK